MIDQAKQQQYLSQMKIQVMLLDNVEGGFTIIYNDKRYIVTNKNYDEITRYWIIEHELSHNLLDNLYDSSTSTDKIKIIENDTNVYTAYKDNIMPIAWLCFRGYITKEFVYENLKIEENLFEAAIKEVAFKCMKGVIEHEKHN